MNKRDARRWARRYAGALLRNFGATDSVLLDDAGEERSDEDVGRLQVAILELANQLDPLRPEHDDGEET